MVLAHSVGDIHRALISEAKLLLLAALAGGLWVDTASFNGEAIPCPEQQ